MDLDALHMSSTGLSGMSQCRCGDGVADELAKQKGLHAGTDKKKQKMTKNKKEKKKKRKGKNHRFRNC